MNRDDFLFRLTERKSNQATNMQLSSNPTTAQNQLARQSRQQRGFTLTEVLVAVVLTLILLGLMIRAFSISGSEITRGRALLELAGQLRSTTELLRSDLNGATAKMLTRNSFGSATGYFEYIEGIAKDNTVHTFKNGNNDPSAMYGDIDDILMFTARSLDQPFRGRFGGQIIESNTAEIIWWTVFNDENGDGQFDVGEDLRLFRRVLLIRPDLTTTSTDLAEFLQFNDVSVRQDPNNNILSNTLSDLTDRANRFARAGTAFPHEPNFAVLQGSDTFVLKNPTTNGTANLSAGNDIMLAAVVAFDVRAFDPVVELQETADGTVSIGPSDFGYQIGNPVSGYGEYVDLGVNLGNGIFTANANTRSLLTTPAYCTWSRHYESDGVDQDGDGDIDEGIDGVDNNNQYGIDDVAEFETSPPYPYPLRGIQITIRIHQPTVGIVRQSSVIANFVPE